MPVFSCFDLDDREKEEVRLMEMNADLQKQVIRELALNMSRHREILEKMVRMYMELEAENRRLSKRLARLERKK